MLPAFDLQEGSVTLQTLAVASLKQRKYFASLTVRSIGLVCGELEPLRVGAHPPKARVFSY